MAAPTLAPTDHETFFNEDEIIVSKTDAKGIITYANDVFLRVAGYKEDEVLGQPHNMIRHPDMPRCVFKLLWDTLESGEEIFAYVVNLAKSGDHYWVFAHVTPTFDPKGNIVGYHSSRRVPDRVALEKIIKIYRELLQIEAGAASKSEGLDKATSALLAKLAEAGIGYPEFVFSL